MEKMIPKKIEDLGYSDFFESNRKKLGLGDFAVARVVAEHRGAYKVINTDGEYFAQITGKQIFNALSREDYPAVGDWVAISKADKDRAVIHSVLPRKTIIKRKHSGKNEVQVIATNIDVALVVESVDRDFNLNRFERYFALANDGGVRPAIILNKTDLISKDDLNSKLAQIKKRFGDVDFISTSTLTNEGLDELRAYIKKAKTYCFLGSSGVGKSSLINKLLGRDIIKTESIGLYADRGKHITTSRQMYFLPASPAGGENGGIVIDNPGIREVGMADATVGVDILFDQITASVGRCKYVDCTHTHEPGCEVLAALKAGKLDEDKYSNYVNLKKEAEHYEMTELEKREKDRQFGKFLKSAKKDLKNHKR